MHSLHEIRQKIGVSQIMAYIRALGQTPFPPKDATVAEISNVQFFFGHHLHWPDLDVDLDVDSLEHPEKYPLIAKYTPRRESRRKKAA